MKIDGDLEVFGGDIRVKGGNFIDDGGTLKAPDYVFEDGYRLMSLGELKEYVALEKHLPNVPSSEEIRKNGLNLSQFQMRLLEKIEELTLYTLEQQEERLEAQQLQIVELRTGVEKQAMGAESESAGASFDSSPGSVGSGIAILSFAAAWGFIIVVASAWYARRRWSRPMPE